MKPPLLLRIFAIILFVGCIGAFIAYRSDLLFADDNTIQTHAAEGGAVITNKVDTPPPNTEIMPSSKIMILPKEIKEPAKTEPAKVDSPQPKKTMMYSTKSAYIVDPADTPKPVKQKQMMGGSKSFKIAKPKDETPQEPNAPANPK